MKLIIDIPEDYFETIKHEVGWNNVKPYNLIANGIPLDKIRSEIEEQKNHRFFDDDDMCIYKAGLIDALEIIDRYRNEVSE